MQPAAADTAAAAPMLPNSVQLTATAAFSPKPAQPGTSQQPPPLADCMHAAAASEPQMHTRKPAQKRGRADQDQPQVELGES